MPYYYSPVFGHPTNYVKLLGDIKRNETGHIVGASALLSLFMVHVDFLAVNFDESGNDAGTADWVSQFLLKIYILKPKACAHF